MKRVNGLDRNVGKAGVHDYEKKLRFKIPRFWAYSCFRFSPADKASVKF